MSDGDFQRPIDETLMGSILKSVPYDGFITKGVLLIHKERVEQLEKHKRTVELDYKLNADYQLVDAAIKLLKGGQHECPEGWDIKIWEKMLAKSEQEKLVTAGALIAAEIDRLNYNI